MVDSHAILYRPIAWEGESSGSVCRSSSFFVRANCHNLSPLINVITSIAIIQAGGGGLGWIGGPGPVSGGGLEHGDAIAPTLLGFAPPVPHDATKMSS